nr:PDZ domain-containing protein [Akkermansiaceae bacterium]
DWEPWSRLETGFQGEKGAFIFDVVTNSPAEKAGIKPFDVVLEYDGKMVESRLHFFSLIQRTKVGREVAIKVWRNGDPVDLLANVIDADEADSVVREEPKSRSPSDEMIAQNIGLTVQRLTVLQRTRGGRGVVVTAVLPGSQAHERHVLPGDLILAVNKVAIDAPGDFYARLIASAAVQDTTIVVQRGRGTYRVEFDAVPRTSDGPER